MAPNKRILITGGAGFIGSNLALKLTAQGHHVTVMDNLSPQIHGAAPEASFLFRKIVDKVAFVRGDVRVISDWHKALAGQDAVVHLAAETGTGQSMYQVGHYTDVNIGGTAVLLDLLANHNEYAIKRLVVASSRAIYGEGRYFCQEHGIIFPNARSPEAMGRGDFTVKCPRCSRVVTAQATDEGSRVHPTSVYGITKATQEQMCLTVGHALGIQTTAFRYQNVYGPGQSLTNPYTGILSIFSTRILNGNPINIFEDGAEARDFVYIDDVVEATAAAVTTDHASGAYNIGTGRAIDVLTVAKILVEKFHCKVPIEVSGAFRVGDIRTNFADTSRARVALSWSSRVPFEEGIAAFAAWVKTQGVVADTFVKSMEEMRGRGLLK